MSEVSSIFAKRAAAAPAPVDAGAHRPVSASAPSIQVALATCDSELYLAALLGSLFGQTRQDFTILLADDASRDGTQAIVDAYAAHYPGRIRQLPGEGPRRGVIANFDRL